MSDISLILPRIGVPTNLRPLYSPIVFTLTDPDYYGVSSVIRESVRKVLYRIIGYNNRKIPAYFEVSQLSKNQILVEFLRDDFYGYAVLNLKYSSKCNYPIVCNSSLYVAPLSEFVSEFEVALTYLKYPIQEEWPVVVYETSDSWLYQDGIFRHLARISLAVELAKIDQCVLKINQNEDLSRYFNFKKIHNNRIYADPSDTLNTYWVIDLKPNKPVMRIMAPISRKNLRIVAIHTERTKITKYMFMRKKSLKSLFLKIMLDAIL